MVAGSLGGNDRIAFPQIGISKSKYPQSVLHMTEAWKGVKSQYRDAIPVKAPRLLTLDRDNATKRRAYNLRSPVPKRCPDEHPHPQTGVPVVDERDEFPPATFEESADFENGTRRANIRCIFAWDNKGSGASLKAQFNDYQPRSTSTKKYTIPNEGVVEFVVAP